VRIDRSDLADPPDSAEVVHYVRAAHDNQESAGRDQGTNFDGGGRLDSSPAAVDSAVRIERSTAYHAAVEAAYRQYAIDHGGAAGESTVADVPTGARGPASRREFDPEAAGGPIRQLDAGKAEITKEGVQEVAAHLRRFTGGGPLDAPE
jgi:hypothetical protein